MRKNNAIIISAIMIIALLACNQNREVKGFRIEKETEKEVDHTNDTLKFSTQPGEVLISSLQDIRITPLYKLNYNDRNKTYFTGENEFFYHFDENDNVPNNQWHFNLMPGFKTMNGYNLVNLALYNVKDKSQLNIFSEQVLIKNLYFPSFSSDTLYGKAIKRDFFIVTVYDEDTNHDKFINPNDMRRIYYFDQKGKLFKEIVPKDYHVFKSQYDAGNDYMLIFARHDSNADGTLMPTEAVDIFYLDLKKPENHGLLYNTQAKNN